ncbi:nucleotide exchange factor GrpE [Faecalispora anaeroviscerum]|uniref:nucleotide exchange factor GrpE n=1 Tax=Faecalispora anaeroviscerum TaxID=2991836 RepID=UPI0024B9932E|nr:nucleotide exchange factor GrpE [Faecalispora anaeroviscerum]
MSKQDAVKKAAKQAEEAADTQKEKEFNAAEQPQAETPGTDSGDAQLKKLQEQLEQSSAELEKQKDLLLRTAAEYDNYRKRTEREKTMVYTDATADTIEKVLPVCDNLERALAQQGGSAEDLRKGVEMVLGQLNGALSKMGVAVIGLQGEPFNPEIHNAVSHIEDANLGENVVAEVLQKGYRIGERIIRHAIVQVAN